MNGKFAFVDMIPRDNRLWETEAHQLKTQLVDEFLAWSAGRAKIANAKAKKNGYGLYAIRPQIIVAPVTIFARSAPVGEIYQLNDVELPTQKSDLLEDAGCSMNQKTASQHQMIYRWHLNMDPSDAVPPEKTARPAINLSAQRVLFSKTSM